jgi:hypothetical protein
MSEQVGTKVAGEPTSQMSIGQYLGRLLKRSRPTVVISGQPDKPVDGRPGHRFVGVDVDTELLERTAHVRKPKETMMQFFSRVGLGASQIREMSKDQITHFVEVVSQQETAVEPTTFITLGPITAPPRFVITDL